MAAGFVIACLIFCFLAVVVAFLFLAFFRRGG
jgi:hypothetical protein